MGSCEGSSGLNLLGSNSAKGPCGYREGDIRWAHQVNTQHYTCQ